MNRISLRWCVALLCLPTLGCDAVAGLLGQNSTNLILVNETEFAAAPDIRTSNSRNVVEDAFTTGTKLSGFGNNGTLAPGQSVNITLSCDALERIAIDGAAFKDASFGFPVGDSNQSEVLRRDTHFDCGDTIRVQMSGTLFNYQMSVTVEAGEPPANGLMEWLASFGEDNASGETEQSSGNFNNNEDGDDEIADKLDELFN